MRLLLAFAFFLCYFVASAYDATRERGQTGQEVVDASVGQVEDTCIFSNDRLFMRRLAFVESQFGTINAPGVNLGGIWRLDEKYFNQTLQAATTHGNDSVQIFKDLQINYTTINYDNNDMSIPINNAVATRFYFNISQDPIPWTIDDQATYYATYYNTTTGAKDYFLNGVTNIPDVCQSPGADVLFMLDGSGSIGPANFNLMLNFLINITASFQLGLDYYQIGVLVFSTAVQPDYITFNSYNWDLAKLQNLIKNLKYPAGGTRTDIALNFALNTMFTVGGGVRPDSEGYPRVGIVITDGQSNQPTDTQIAATQDKQAGIVLFSVGVGSSIDQTELNGIASVPTCMHVYNLNDFAGLSQGFPEELKSQTCVAPAIIQPNQSIINNAVQYNQYMYFTFSVNQTAGATFQLAMSQGQAGLYLSTQYTHPSDVQYDFYIPPTGGQSSVYISPDSLSSFVANSFKSMVAYFGIGKREAPPTSDVGDIPLFASIKGTSQGYNNFTITIFEGYQTFGASSKLVFNAMLYLCTLLLICLFGN